jgi:hypothetical protein
MKKLLAIAIVLMMVPFTAFSMETISDSDMDNVTGQAGVSISLDNVKIYQLIEGISYTDTDGLGDATGATGGTISIDNIEQVITLNAIGGEAMMATDGAQERMAKYATAGFAAPKALTIDIAAITDDVKIAAMGGSTTAIVIGLPTLEITVSEFSFDLSLQSGTNAAQSFGTFVIGNQTVAILSGTIIIAAH